MSAVLPERYSTHVANVLDAAAAAGAFCLFTTWHEGMSKAAAASSAVPSPRAIVLPLPMTALPGDDNLVSPRRSFPFSLYGA